MSCTHAWRPNGPGDNNMAFITGDRYEKFNSLMGVRKLFSVKRIYLEIDLMNDRKWFNYKFMDPLDATKLFTRIYVNQYKRVFRANFDVEKAKHVHGIRLNKFIASPQERTQIWLARQRADATGMPYNVYIELSLDFALRRRRKTIPRPNQLHHHNCPREWNSHRAETWHDYLKDLRPVAEHPAYRIENYRGLSAQDDYRKFILDRVSASSSPLSSLMELYCDDLESDSV